MQDTLYRDLVAFSVGDPEAPLSFTARLARDQGWSRPFADRVVDEYRRFLWLAVRAGHPVTPSLAVDEAWHLHLCYTRSYWDELCGRILGRPLHHDPTRGGTQEGHKFRDWYATTLASYRRHFGEPPADIWPSVEERFRRRTLRPVDVGAHWIVPKRPLASVAASAIALLTAGCAGGDTVLAVGLSAVAVIVVGWVCFYALRPEHPESPNARLGGGEKGEKKDKSDGGDGGTGCGSGCGTHGHGDAGGDGGADGGGSGCGGGGGGGCGGCGG